MTSAVHTDCQHLSSAIADLTLQDQSAEVSEQMGSESYGFCAICLDKIPIQETALVKGCEHAYCVNCILRWASYKENTTCPQCKHPFESLIVHRALDGSMQVYMQEESVCLLLRATWFEPLVLKHQEEVYDEMDDLYAYGYADDDDDDGEDMDEAYYPNSTIRLGNRRWGDNGYVRSGRQEARPIYHPNHQASGSGSSREPKQKQPTKPAAGRRAKRALKREAADKAAAAKHQMHLERMGRK
uniref:RING-type domain-containing protein n=1 Tax=Kalanchoe fedtschenkoi TaxID=63787 RepID=A0A7N1A0B5_KALFE